MGKDQRLHLRLDDAARIKLLEACRITGLDEPTILRAMVTAFVEHIEEHGEITLPLAILPKSSLEPEDNPIAPSRPQKFVNAPTGPVFAQRNPSASVNEDPPSGLPNPKPTRARRALQDRQRREKKTGKR